MRRLTAGALATVLLAACASAREGAAQSPGETPPELIDSARVYLVELADTSLDRLPPGARRSGETFGCGDRLVALEVDLQTPAATPEERVAAALAGLLAFEERGSGSGSATDGLYDALRRSDLQVVEVTPLRLAAEEGIYRVRLAGRLRVGGACDVPRIRRQIEATATQFPGVSGVEVYVGEEPLDKLLSARGAG